MSKGNRRLLMGNEAMALGAVEAGVQVVASYPGTPSTEITDTILRKAKDHPIYAEWSINEKVALETAAAAAMAGARALSCMKQVGLNVASDPLMTLSYLGVRGGLVLIVADDPGPHSSQTEQDTRLFARFAQLPVLDPATPLEARELLKKAFDISEALKLPVILRPTTRTCHVCQEMEVGDIPPAERPATTFDKDPNWVIFPSHAYKKHQWLVGQQQAAQDLFAEMGLNTVEPGQGKKGFIVSGVSYTYLKEALETLGATAPILKVATPYPLPGKLVKEFIAGLDEVLVVEEQEPVVEDQVMETAWRHKLTLELCGKRTGHLPREGEFSVDLVGRAAASFLGLAWPNAPAVGDLPALPLRTPILCAGCPHRASFYAFKRAARGKDTVFNGDIGCYTLGVMPPLKATDTVLCMGAAPSMAAGMYRVEPHRPHVAFLGDSTFFHSGLPGLINAIFNKANITLAILDNRTTAMTGCQTHPGIGQTGMQEPTVSIDIKKVCEAVGVEFIRTVDAYDLKALTQAAKEAMEFPGPSVVIVERECVQIVPPKTPYAINPETCTVCGACLTQYGCPAIYRTADDRIAIAPEKCFGCSMCAQICPTGAIAPIEKGGR